MQMSARKVSKAFPAKIKVHEDRCSGSTALCKKYLKSKNNLFSRVFVCSLRLPSVSFPPSSSLSFSNWIVFLIVDFSWFLILSLLLACSKLHIAWHDNWRNAKPVCTTGKMRTLCSSPNRISFGSTLSFIWPTCECARPYNSISDIVLLTIVPH